MPLHTHDCDACVYLGTLRGTDHYFCPKDKSLIQRFGSEGWEYCAWPLADISLLPAQLVARWELTLALKHSRAA
jgi:hypothetical protein